MAGSILGIDAAWTDRNPSGVALVARTDDGWRLSHSEPSYPRFLDADVGHGASAGALLARAEELSGAPVDLVAIDMPLAISPIAARRACDNCVSKAYGGHWCSTHSPSEQRPGKLSDTLRAEFHAAGYSLALAQPTGNALIEVYPHIALIELTGAAKRLKYKVSKTRKYWPQAATSERRRELVVVWAGIVDHLDGVVAGTAEALIPPAPDAPTKTLKSFEDKLDAVICAWVGIRVIEGRARPLGDADSAIWVPDSKEGR